MKSIKIIKPDDWHVHFREGDILKHLVNETSKIYGRAIVMPNLSIPITNSKLAQNYKDTIQKYSANVNFKPLITFYLTENININDLIKAYENDIIFAVKLYPSGVTTNSSQGVKKIDRIYSILEIMSDYKIPLLIHGEVNNKNVDVFDREKVFIKNELQDIINNFPKLKITLEHITTRFAVDFVNNARSNVRASITPHHLLINRSDMLEHKIRPHYYCLPILKREEDRKALVQAAISGNENFFLGTDSAPHTLSAKEAECGCAGIFNTINSIETLAQLFDNCEKIDNLEKFSSINGARHYEININNEKIELIKTTKKLNFTEYLLVNNEKYKIFTPPFNVFWHKKFK